MGHNTAVDLAENTGLEQGITIHLRNNHYPPVPYSMVPVCIAAVIAYNNGYRDGTIQLPEGVTYKGKDIAPAWDIINQHHLDAWIDGDDE